MLKFFRKIRQNLIDQRDAKRYLLYALGEILLVMIGILLALQVNTWNQDRLNQVKMAGLLSQLQNDIEADIFLLNENNKIDKSVATVTLSTHKNYKKAHETTTKI